MQTFRLHLLETALGGLGSGALGSAFEINSPGDSKVGDLGTHFPCSVFHGFTAWKLGASALVQPECLHLCPLVVLVTSRRNRLS